MAILTLENNWLKVSFNTFGAELTSLIEKNENTEHVWQADPAIWKRHAPILFPIVGQVENNTYQIGDQKYEMGQHGFARDKEFEVEMHTADSIVFVLESSEDTLKNYPYQFRLYVTYTLLLDKLEVNYKVVNIDSQAIFFSIGGHPAFVCPFNENEEFSDYFVQFEKPETATRLLFANGLLNGEKVEEFLSDNDTLQLSYELFDQDAVILEGLQSDYVDLKSTKSNKSLRFYFKGFPLFALWTKPGKNGKFLCLEPWFGVSDVQGQQKEFTQKPYIESLEEGETFSCFYSVTFQA